jgi:beta-aspartyl-peptidase (threonine type)
MPVVVNDHGPLPTVLVDGKQQGGSKSVAENDEAVHDRGEVSIVVFDEARRLLASQEEAWNRGDLDAFMAGYWKSERLSFRTGRDEQFGWEATYRRYKQRYQSDGKEMGKLKFSELQFESISPNCVLCRGRWALIRMTGQSDGLFSLILQKTPEGLRITHDHTSVGETVNKDPKPQ